MKVLMLLNPANFNFPGLLGLVQRFLPLTAQSRNAAPAETIQFFDHEDEVVDYVKSFRQD